MIAQNMSLDMLLSTAAALSISGHLCLDFPCLCAVVALIWIGIAMATRFYPTDLLMDCTNRQMCRQQDFFIVAEAIIGNVQCTFWCAGTRSTSRKCCVVTKCLKLLGIEIVQLFAASLAPSCSTCVDLTRAADQIPALVDFKALDMPMRTL